MTTASKNNVLFILIGAPGSGKSTEVAKLEKSVPNNIIVSSDTLRAKFGSDENDQSVTPKVFSYIKRMLPVFLNDGKNVILDATNMTVRDRKEYIDMAKQNGSKVVGIAFERDKATLLDRNKKRGDAGGRNVPEFVIDKMLAKYQKPTSAEGFDKILFL